MLVGLFPHAPLSESHTILSKRVDVTRFLCRVAVRVQVAPAKVVCCWEECVVRVRRCVGCGWGARRTSRVQQHTAHAEAAHIMASARMTTHGQQLVALGACNGIQARLNRIQGLTGMHHGLCMSCMGGLTACSDDVTWEGGMQGKAALQHVHSHCMVPAQSWSTSCRSADALWTVHVKVELRRGMECMQGKLRARRTCCNTSPHSEAHTKHCHQTECGCMQKGATTGAVVHTCEKDDNVRLRW
jgi:Zn ribbon nucleic-acid-binding protein